MVPRAIPLLSDLQNQTRQIEGLENPLFDEIARGLDPLATPLLIDLQTRHAEPRTYTGKIYRQDGKYRTVHFDGRAFRLAHLGI